MLVYELSICENASFLATVLFIKNIVRIISYIIPVVLILFITVDIGKAVMANDDSQMKKAQSLGIKRMIWAIAVFFVPMMVNAVFSLLDGQDIEGISCYNNATDGVVEALQVAEGEKLLKYEEDTQKLIEASKKSKTTKDKEINNLRKKAERINKKNSKNSGTTIKVSNKYIQAKKIAEAAGGGRNCSDSAGHTNCPLGDQTGEEVDINNWRKGWIYILRAKDPEKANKAAACMRAAAKNDNIGYGQHGFSKYYGLWEYLKKRGDWDVSTVNKKVSVSCCPLVAVCLKYAGFHPSRELDCQRFKPGGMKREVYKAGDFMQVYPGKSQNLSNIRRGDILINNYHMAMAV